MRSTAGRPSFFQLPVGPIWRHLENPILYLIIWQYNPSIFHRFFELRLVKNS